MWIENIAIIEKNFHTQLELIVNSHWVHLSSYEYSKQISNYTSVCVELFGDEYLDSDSESYEESGKYGSVSKINYDSSVCILKTLKDPTENDYITESAFLCFVSFYLNKYVPKFKGIAYTKHYSGFHVQGIVMEYIEGDILEDFVNKLRSDNQDKDSSLYTYSESGEILSQ